MGFRAKRDAHAPFATVVSRSIPNQDAPCAHSVREEPCVIASRAHANQYKICLAWPEGNAGGSQSILQALPRGHDLADISVYVLAVVKRNGKAGQTDLVDVIR